MKSSQEQRYINFSNDSNFNSQKSVHQEKEQWGFLAQKITHHNPKRFNEMIAKVDDRELLKSFVKRLGQRKAAKQASVDIKRQKAKLEEVTPENVPALKVEPMKLFEVVKSRTRQPNQVKVLSQQMKTIQPRTKIANKVINSDLSDVEISAAPKGERSTSPVLRETIQ